MLRRTSTRSAARRIRHTVAGGVVAALAGGLAAVTPALPASAAPETSTIESGTEGVLSNQVQWEVDAGTVVDGRWSLPGSDVNTMVFDRPVDLRFGVTGLNAGNEDVKLPEGTEVEFLDPSHTWDPVEHVVSGPGQSCQTCVSTFILEDTTVLTGQRLSNLTWERAIVDVEVTYDLPVAVITGPAEGGTYELGDGDPLEFSCADGGGDVTGRATIDGEPIDNGAAVDAYGVGTHTIEVTCTDEYGATHTSSVTFEVVDERPAAPACPEDGLAVGQPPHMPPGSKPPLASGTVHEYVEPVAGLIGLDGLVHDLNCELVEPVEDLADDLLIPVVTEVKKALKGLLRLR